MQQWRRLLKLANSLRYNEGLYLVDRRHGNVRRIAKGIFALPVGFSPRGYAYSANQKSWLAANPVRLRIGMSAARRRRLGRTSRAGGSAGESLAIG